MAPARATQASRTMRMRLPLTGRTGRRGVRWRGGFFFFTARARNEARVAWTAILVKGLRSFGLLATLGAALLQCGSLAPVAPSPPPPLPALRTVPILADGSYWEDIAFTIVSTPSGQLLPLEDKDFVREGGGGARFDALSDDAKDKLRSGAVVVVHTAAHESKVGDVYAKLRAERVPYVITMDALFALVQAAIGSALDEMERTALQPSMLVMLASAEGRLEGERKGARTDTEAAYALARTVVAVARKLLDPGYELPKELVVAANDELGRIASHLGLAPSKLLGRVVDYGEFDVQAGLNSGDPRLGAFRARAWLGSAALLLAAKGDARSPVDVAQLRTQTRAAMLLTHALRSDVDPPAAAASERIELLESFVFGPSDDFTARSLSRLAVDVSVDLRDGSTFANVARVDHLRLASAKEGLGRVNDLGLPTSRAEAPVTTFRLLAATAPPGAVAMTKLVAPHVGKFTGQGAPISFRDGVRAFPPALDLAAAMGSVEARAVLHETGDDAYEGYEAALDALTSTPQDPRTRHRYVVLSYLDALRSYLAPSGGDPAQPFASSVAWRRHKLDTGLAAWSALRHFAVPFAHVTARDIAPEPSTADANPTPAAVEPHPEAVARLLGLVRQLRRGLMAQGGLPRVSAVAPLLESLDGLLVDALDVALRETTTTPLGVSELRTLDTFPARIVALERALDVGAAAPWIAPVHLDVATGRVLEEGSGYLEDGYFLLRMPGAPLPAMFVGVHVPHAERVSTLRTTDATWRGQLEKGIIPSPDWKKSFRVE